MNNKLLFPAAFAACLLLGYGPVATAEAEKRTEPVGSAEADDSQEVAESWTSGAPSPDDADAERAERRAEEEVVENLDPVDPDETRPSPGQAQQAQEANAERNASDRCLVSTVEAVLEADRAGHGSDVVVDAQDGVVSLTGTLADEASIEQIRTLVAGVKGVASVDTGGLTTAEMSQARSD